MVEIINTSFIPKQALSKKKKKKGFKINVFFLISLVIFLSTIIGAVGVTLWKMDIEKTNEEFTKQLTENRDDYSIDSIKKFSDLNKRIQAGNILLNNHYNVLPIFRFLEAETQTNIVLTELNLEERDSVLAITAQGLAPALSDLYLQSKSYGKNQNIKNLVMSNISRTQDGLVSFDLEFEVDKKDLSIREFSSSGNNN